MTKLIIGSFVLCAILLTACQRTTRPYGGVDEPADKIPYKSGINPNK